MQGSLYTILTHSPMHHIRPMLVLLDAEEECSFYHWLEVQKLVDEEDSPTQKENPPASGQASTRKN